MDNIFKMIEMINQEKEKYKPQVNYYQESKIDKKYIDIEQKAYESLSESEKNKQKLEIQKKYILEAHNIAYKFRIASENNLIKPGDTKFIDLDFTLADTLYYMINKIPIYINNQCYIFGKDEPPYYDEAINELIFRLKETEPLLRNFAEEGRL